MVLDVAVGGETPRKRNATLPDSVTMEELCKLVHVSGELKT